MSDLGVETREDDMVTMQNQLNHILIEELQARRKFVLVIDEAQNLDDSALEFVRMLSNFETPREKLMHIVLAGQTQLGQTLGRSSMVQLRQRISMVVRLRALTSAETGEYIEHRLRVAGHTGGTLFSAGAVREIATLSGGIPRNINNICFNALSLGYAGGQKRIESATIRDVAADLDLTPFAGEKANAFAPLQAPESQAEANMSPKRNGTTRAAGWAVLLDRIPSPAGPPLKVASVPSRPSDSWRQSSSWRETVGSLAERFRNRMVH